MEQLVDRRALVALQPAAMCKPGAAGYGLDNCGGRYNAEQGAGYLAE